MGQQTGLHPLRDRSGHRSRQRLAVPLPLLQEWRWRLPHPLLPDAVPSWYPHVLHGVGHGTDADYWWIGSL